MKNSRTNGGRYNRDIKRIPKMSPYLTNDDLSRLCGCCEFIPIKNKKTRKQNYTTFLIFFLYISMTELKKYESVHIIETFDGDKYMIESSMFERFNESMNRDRFVSFGDNSIAVSTIKKTYKQTATDLDAFIFSFPVEIRKQLIAIVDNRIAKGFNTSSADHLAEISKSKGIIN